MSDHEIDHDGAATGMPDGAAKLDLHHRQQLSALLDGALAPDEARFLLRRLQHDTTLAACWERWHLAGEVLRGRTQAPLPAGFNARVAEVVALEPPVRGRRQGGPTAVDGRQAWRHGLGIAALAASVAAVALFVARPLSVDSELPAGAPPIAIEFEPAAPAPSAGPGATATIDRAVPASAAPAPRDIAIPARVASIPTASNPPAPGRRSAREAIPTVPDRPARESEPPATSVVAAAQPPQAGPADVAPAAAAPFANPTLPPTRPWPRAVLPQLSDTAAGAFTVDYGDPSQAAASPSFYPFEPRLPVSAEPGPDSAEGPR